MNMLRRAKQVATVVAKDLYEVVTSFHLKHVLVEVGSKIELAAEEAKYHLLAGRVKPVVAPVAAPVVASAAAVVAPVAAVLNEADAPSEDHHED